MSPPKPLTFCHSACGNPASMSGYIEYLDSERGASPNNVINWFCDTCQRDCDGELSLLEAIL
jgi:hypothetical protein